MLGDCPNDLPPTHLETTMHLISSKDKSTRKHDLAELRKDARSPNKDIAQHAREAGSRIAKESRLIRDMRRSLIKAHRQGNAENIKDIHAYIEGKARYQNG